MDFLETIRAGRAEFQFINPHADIISTRIELGEALVCRHGRGLTERDQST